MKRALSYLAFALLALPAADFAKRIRDEYSLWGKVIRETNIEKN